MQAKEIVNKKIIMKKLLFTIVISLSALITYAQWEWQNPIPHGHTLHDVCMLDQNIIIAVGDHGTIIRSNDGGTT